MEPFIFLVPQRTIVKKLQSEDGQRPRYRVQLIRSGTVERRFGVLVIPEDVVKNAVRKFNNVSGYTHQLGQHVPGYLYSEQDKVGFYNNLELVKDNGYMIEADFIAARTQRGVDIAEHLDMSIEEENDLYQQLSAVFSAKTDYVVDTDADGNETLKEIVKSIEAVRSVDFVDVGAFPLKATKKLSGGGLDFNEDDDEIEMRSVFEKLTKGVSMEKYKGMTLEQLKALNLEGLSDAEKDYIQVRIEALEAKARADKLEADKVDLDQYRAMDLETLQALVQDELSDAARVYVQARIEGLEAKAEADRLKALQPDPEPNPQPNIGDDPAVKSLSKDVTLHGNKIEGVDERLKRVEEREKILLRRENEAYFDTQIQSLGSTNPGGHRTPRGNRL